jgi:hypothetical protein
MKGVKVTRWEENPKRIVETTYHKEGAVIERVWGKRTKAPKRKAPKRK